MWYSISCFRQLIAYTAQARCSKCWENVWGSAHYTFCPFLSGELGNVNNACQGAYYWSSNIALKGKCPNVACFRHPCTRYSIFLLLFQEERNDGLIRVAGGIRLGPPRGAARMRRGIAHGERKWAHRFNLSFVLGSRFMHTTNNYNTYLDVHNERTQALLKDFSFIMFWSRVKPFIYLA